MPDPALPTIGYIIPEFPGQTHVWMWREIEAMRAWGVHLRIYSTRRPPPRDKARHEFATEAERETTYLWPLGLRSLLGALAWGLRHPLGLWRCLGLAVSLPLSRRLRALRTLPLILPALQLARRCEQDRVRHLHSHGCSNSAILCMMVKRLLRIPFSMTLNANIEWWGGAMRQKFEDANFTIAITRRLLDEVRRDFPTLAPSQSLLGRIGVDTALWRPGAHRRPDSSPLRLVIVARLHRNKGHDVLLEAMKVLAEQGMDIVLDIIGDGPERLALEDQSRRLHLEPRVTFAGSLGQEEIIDRIRQADIFVLPSRFEPLGVAYMEAMSLEVAAIGTTAGGVSEIIDDGVDGLLVPPEDPLALAGAIRSLALDPALRRRIGLAGRRKIVEQFDSRIGAATLYHRLFDRDPPDAAQTSDAG